MIIRRPAPYLAIPALALALAAPAAAQVPPAIAAELQKIGRVIAPEPTSALYTPLQKKAPQPGVLIVRDVKYGADPKEAMDVFTATQAARAPKPVLLFVHGGGFAGGDKHLNSKGEESAFYDNVMLWGVANGMVGLNFNYPLTPGATYPVVQKDLATAIAWAQANVRRYGGDPNRIYLWGHSAGASHVAAYLSHPEFYIGGKPGIRGAILQSGTYDLAAGAGDQPHAYFGPAAGFAERSATAGLVKTPVPLFVIAAELDPPAMILQANSLQQALCTAKKCPEFTVLKDHSHISETYHLATADQSLATPLLAFIKAH